MIKSVTSTLIACTATAMLGGFAMVHAADAPASAKMDAKMEKLEASKEMREKMASAHAHMAACLRSDKSIDECRSEMMKAHEKMEGAGEERREHDCDKMMMMHEHEHDHDHDHDATK